jgi:hypothetical protein
VPRHRTRLFAGVLLIVVASVAAVAWWLPGGILDRYHRISATMGDDYQGQAGDATVHLRGYSLHDVVVVRRDDAIQTPLIRAREVRVNLDPLRRRADVVVDGLQLHLVASGDGVEQLGAGVPWRRLLDELTPGFSTHRIVASDATAELKLPGLGHAPLPVDQLRFTLEGLDERPTETRPAPARITATGRMLHHATLELEGIFDPDERMQRLNAELRIEAIELARLDAYARFWRGIDFEAGTATASLRLTAQDGRTRGRFVASLRDIDVFDAREDLGRDGDGLLHAARELLTAGGAALSASDGRLEIDQTLDVRIELPEDNLDGLRAILAQSLVSIEPGG